MNIVITAPVQATDILAALAKGEAVVHSEREDGTLRRRHFLADGSADRAVAEWVRLQRTGQEADAKDGVLAVAPRSMLSIAKEMHASIAHVRRVLNDLEITESIEDADSDEPEAMLVGMVEDQAA